MLLARRVEQAARRAPLRASIAATTTNAVIADCFVQKQLEKRESIDRRRLAAFAIFGSCYQGCFQYALFARLLERVCVRPVWAVSPVVQKILLVNCVFDPLLFFPSFYTVKEALASPQLGASETLHAALGNYAENWKQDLRNTWMVWFPGHAVSFGLMPPHLRMPWVAGLSFAYLTVLSFTRGETTESCAAARLPAARLQMRAGD